MLVLNEQYQSEVEDDGNDDKSDDDDDDDDEVTPAPSPRSGDFGEDGTEHTSAAAAVVSSTANIAVA